MSIPVTESIGKARWIQGDDEETNLEIRIPCTLPEGVRPRDLTVEVKDDCILCISHKETRILQWRLYAAVKDEVEWRVEDDNILVAELEKKAGAPWSCLLDLPMRANDELLVPVAEINRMFRSQLPVLPTAEEKASNGAAKSTSDAGAAAAENDGANGAGADGEDDDLDKLLDEAAEEVTGAAAKEVDEDAEVEEGDSTAAFIKAELENYRVEEEEIQKKLTEVAAMLENPTDAEAAARAAEQKGILSEMIRLHNACRAIRSQPSTLENFLQCTQLDLQKARVNIGETGENEEEEYQTDEERELSATALMTCGLKFFEDQDIKGCLHFLRLAAIHHKHEQSTLLLYNIYSQLQSPRGAFLLMRRALDDSAPSAAVNQKVGELYDQGARHFLPLFPAALYFYQRAAKLGHVNGMLSLAQLWLRGCTASSMLSEDEVEAQQSTSKYHAWLQKAMDRGCGSAYFVRGCMHIKGEHGVAKSYASAKEYLDAAAGAQPEILRRAPQIPMMLEMLRAEEEGSAKAKQETSSTSASTSKAAVGPAAVAAPAKPVDDSVKPTPSAARLNALSRNAAGPSLGANGSAAPRTVSESAAMRARRGFGAGGGSRSKLFWERACVTGVTMYGVYTLAFPIRILLLPFFYSVISGLLEAIPWLSNSNADLSMF
ncbi:Mitochondrial import receptor subunit ATOM69 [Novymonas esmeraldas]|uniref:Mitochondrial import receptor subunit ATOM69 n=1 Tax=Novymonas esmeraldas TaxID=1808958 RepID=A0AAW0EX40_9TRYP